MTEVADEEVKEDEEIEEIEDLKELKELEEAPRATVDVRELEDEDRGTLERLPCPEMSGTSPSGPSAPALDDVELLEDGAWPDLLTTILPLKDVSVVDTYVCVRSFSRLPTVKLSLLPGKIAAVFR